MYPSIIEHFINPGKLTETNYKDDYKEKMKDKWVYWYCEAELTVYN